MVSYCKKCGAKLPEGAAYCPNCGTAIEPIAKPVLAGWGERFIAWLIDMIILGAVLAWMTWPGYIWLPHLPRWIPFIDFGSRNLIYFLYWTFMEGVYGQSIGKMVMRIKVTRSNGESTNLVHGAIESLGKALLLPIDCIIGWIFFPARKQRLFNYLSDTIIVKASH